MGELLSKVLPLSLGAAISPTVLALALVILSGRRAIARGATYAVGVLVVLVGLTALGLYGVRTATPTPSTVDIARVIDGFAGALLLLLAAGTILRGALHDPDDPAATDVGSAPPPDRQPGLRGAFLLGMAMMLANFSTILLYLPAMHAIAVADVADTDQAIAVVIAFVITSLPATGPLVFRVIAPGPAGRLFEGLHGFITRHQRQIGVVIEVLFGVYLVVKALG